MRQGDASLPYPSSNGIFENLDIDPDSVSFHPLQQTINGAAITDMISHHSTNQTKDSPERIRDYVYHASSPPREFDGKETNNDNYGFGQDQDGISSAGNGYFNVSLDVDDDDGELVKDRDDDENSIKRRNKPSSSVFSNMIPLNIRLQLAEIIPERFSSPDKSTISAITVVASFVFILFSSSLISKTISRLAGLGPEGNIAIASQKLFFASNSRKVSPQGRFLAPPIGTQLPGGNTLKQFADVDELPLQLLDTAIFWHVPRSAGTSTKGVFAKCLQKVVATEVGGLDEHRLDERIDTLKKPNGIFVNVDTYTIDGVNHAKSLGLAQSKMAEIVFTPFVHESAVLFDEHHRGRLFTILRDPIDRVVSLYYFLRIYDSRVQSQSLEEFVMTTGENWMTRTLSQQMTGPIDETHLNYAKEVLRRKFLIGLLDDKTESFRRFEQYFGWNIPSPFAHNCKNNILYFDWHVKNPHPPLEENDPVWHRVFNMNTWDIHLYEYAVQLFEEQGNLFL